MYIQCSRTLGRCDQSAYLSHRGRYEPTLGFKLRMTCAQLAGTEREESRDVLFLGALMSNVLLYWAGVPDIGSWRATGFIGKRQKWMLSYLSQVQRVCIIVFRAEGPSSTTFSIVEYREPHLHRAPILHKPASSSAFCQDAGI